jgi:large subunit ribosomal protein L25
MATDEIVLPAETGRPTGSPASRRLRTEGKVPGVVYGQGADPVAVAVEWRELRQALTTDAGLNALISIEIDGERQLSIVKEMQRDPVRREVTHVDFLRISRDVAIEVEVPIVLEGEAEAVERENGNVTHALFNLLIKAKPDAIPNEITVDISALEIGDSIRVADLVLPSGVTTEVDPEEPVASAQAQAQEELPEPGEGEEGEGEEGAEGEGGESAGDAEASAGDGEGGGGDSSD